jgi:hypothetical protein
LETQSINYLIARIISIPNNFNPEMTQTYWDLRIKYRIRLYATMSIPEYNQRLLAISSVALEHFLGSERKNAITTDDCVKIPMVKCSICHACKALWQNHMLRIITEMTPELANDLSSRAPVIQGKEDAEESPKQTGLVPLKSKSDSRRSITLPLSMKWTSEDQDLSNAIKVLNIILRSNVSGTGGDENQATSSAIQSVISSPSGNVVMTDSMLCILQMVVLRLCESQRSCPGKRLTPDPHSHQLSITFSDGVLRLNQDTAPSHDTNQATTRAYLLQGHSVSSIKKEIPISSVVSRSGVKTTATRALETAATSQNWTADRGVWLSATREIATERDWQHIFKSSNFSSRSHG